jgi:hypothetical protein
MGCLKLSIAELILIAYAEQRDEINDSDLDDEQPIKLSVSLTLGNIRQTRLSLKLGNQKNDRLHIESSN